jgi:hypothetical protein
MFLATGPAWVAAGAQAASGTWADVKVPLPANADHTFAQLYSVACPSAKACTAVGAYTGSAGWRGLLLAKSGPAWTAAQAPVPTGAAADPYATITSVSCLTVSVCAAIGSYTDSSGNTQGLLLTRSGSAWKAAKAPLPPGAAPSSVFLSGVRCASPSYCVAVGFYTDSSSGNQQGFIVTGFGATWAATSAPLPADAGTPAQSHLESVGCSGPAACTAVGDYTDTLGDDNGLILTSSGSSWTATRAPLPSGVSPPVSLAAVRCLAASLCVAVGEASVGRGYRGLLVSGSGTTWSATAPPLPANSVTPPQAQLQTLACTVATCTVAGTYAPAGSNRAGLITTGSGSTWTASKAPQPGNASQDPGTDLGSVSCTSAGACVIAGNYQTASRNNSSMLLLGSGSSWSLNQPPFPGNAANATISAVSCAKTATACIAAGFYLDHSGNDQALLITGPP